MDKADKKMVRVWVHEAEHAANGLRDLAHTYRRDKDLSRVLTNIASDLTYVNLDVLDTLDRL